MVRERDYCLECTVDQRDSCVAIASIVSHKPFVATKPLQRPRGILRDSQGDTLPRELLQPVIVEGECTEHVEDRGSRRKPFRGPMGTPCCVGWKVKVYGSRR